MEQQLAGKQQEIDGLAGQIENLNQEIARLDQEHQEREVRAAKRREDELAALSKVKERARIMTTGLSKTSPMIQTREPMEEVVLAESPQPAAMKPGLPRPFPTQAPTPPQKPSLLSPLAPRPLAGKPLPRPVEPPRPALSVRTPVNPLAGKPVPRPAVLPPRPSMPKPPSAGPSPEKPRAKDEISFG